MKPTNEDEHAEYRFFIELLPWYLNGSLTGEDKAWADDYLARNPDTRRELEFERSIAGQVVRTVDAMDADVGFEQLMQRVKQSQLQVVKPVEKPRGWSFMSLFERLGEALQDMGQRNSGFAVASVVAAQALVIALLVTNNEGAEQSSQYRSLGGAPVHTLSVQFRTSATEQQIRTLLQQQGAEFYSGPSQLGEYRIVAEQMDLEQVLVAFKSSPIVESAALEKNGATK